MQTAILYASNGSGGWEQTSAVFPYISIGTGDHKVIEWSVPLSRLGIDDEQSIHAGFLSNSYASPDAGGDPAVISLAAVILLLPLMEMTAIGMKSNWCQRKWCAIPAGCCSRRTEAVCPGEGEEPGSAQLFII